MNGQYVEPADLFRWGLRWFFSVALVTFALQWFLKKLSKWYRLYTGGPTEAISNEVRERDSLQRQEALRERLQAQHATKASDYKERILVPREEAKKKQKDKEFYQFNGPAWKGKGQALGADEDETGDQEVLDGFEADLNPREMAAVRRRIQRPTPQPPKPPEKPKRVINLPNEPSEQEPDSVQVILRSPIQTVYKRRFRHSDSVQTLLDFMTVSGFSQTFNTLSMSFPRRNLSGDKTARLDELGFKGRVTLNIEEIDL